MFNNIYKGKRVFITGHTGFKGSWLTSWLLSLDAKICGYSIDIPSNPSMYETLDLGKRINDIRGDICNIELLYQSIDEFNPDIVFHLAAQPIVSKSYNDPISTIKTNVLGTANVLEVIRKRNKSCVVVVITSDKCYKNVEWEWGYRETDALGGKDIYSGSKGAAELVFNSYYNSFFTNNSNIRLATTRAGNVIGGGDWALDRIVPDCMRAWAVNKNVEIRSPLAVRPWEHVLEPLSGYLQLGAELLIKNTLSGQSFNFGPVSSEIKTVQELLSDLRNIWSNNSSQGFIITDHIQFKEATLLKLNCDKAYFYLKWLPTLDYNQTVKLTGNWYKDFYCGSNMYDITLTQIQYFYEIAKEKNIVWTKNE